MTIKLINSLRNDVAKACTAGMTVAISLAAALALAGWALLLLVAMGLCRAARSGDAARVAAAEATRVGSREAVPVTGSQPGAAHELPPRPSVPEGALLGCERAA
jgi:hypothetical protein